MSQNKHALILGVSGGFGKAVAEALLQNGWSVRGLSRSKPSILLQGREQVEWIRGDAMSRNDVVNAAKDVSVIVHGVNPSNYMNWDELVLPMIDNTIAAAKAAGGARIVLPGAIYNYDPASTSMITEGSPQKPLSRKGKIRVTMEQRLEDAAPEVPCVILRCGDFFGPGAVKASWFSQVMISQGKPVKRIINVAKGAGHSWAFLPDVAKTVARLLEAEETLSAFERLNFEGYYDHNGRIMIEALERVTGRKLPVFQFPWWVIHLMSYFVQWAKEASEIAPYWQNPVRLDNSRLLELIAEEPRTDLDEAIRHTLVSLGSLKADDMALDNKPKTIRMPSLGL